MMNRWVLYLLFLCLCPIPIQGQDTAEEMIAFLKRGWTKELEEEFGWRIEALRGVEVK